MDKTTTGYQYHDKRGEHLHTFEDKALFGTTTVINSTYPPPLAWWGSGKAIELFGWRDPKKTLESEVLIALHDGLKKVHSFHDIETYGKFLDECYRNHDKTKKQAAKKGTDAHAEIETYIGWCLEHHAGKPVVPPETTIPLFVEFAAKNIEQFLWSEKCVFSKELWTGGICDWGAVLKDGSVVIGDNKPSIYPKHFIQVAGYGLQAKENGVLTTKGEKILDVSRIDGYAIFDYKTGNVRYRKEIEDLEADFRHTVKMYMRRDVIGTETWK